MRDRLACVPVPGIDSVAMIIPRRQSDSFVEFTVHIPRVAAHGAHID